MGSKWWYVLSTGWSIYVFIVVLKLCRAVKSSVKPLWLKLLVVGTHELKANADFAIRNEWEDENTTARIIPRTDDVKMLSAEISGTFGAQLWHQIVRRMAHRAAYYNSSMHVIRSSAYQHYACQFRLSAPHRRSAYTKIKWLIHYRAMFSAIFNLISVEIRIRRFQLLRTLCSCNVVCRTAR